MIHQLAALLPLTVSRFRTRFTHVNPEHATAARQAVMSEGAFAKK